MIQTLTKNWLLLALCGVVYAIISVHLLSHAGREWTSDISLMERHGCVSGEAQFVAGACTIAAGLWRSATGKCWLLVLNGVALGMLGLIQYGFTRYRISFLTLALLIILMAMSMGILELVIARTLRHQQHIVDGWFLAFAGMTSFGFAAAFLILGFGWIKMQPGSHPDLLWLGYRGEPSYESLSGPIDDLPTLDTILHLCPASSAG